MTNEVPRSAISSASSGFFGCHICVLFVWTQTFLVQAVYKLWAVDMCVCEGNSDFEGCILLVTMIYHIGMHLHAHRYQSHIPTRVNSSSPSPLGLPPNDPSHKCDAEHLFMCVFSVYLHCEVSSVCLKMWAVGAKEIVSVG